MTSFYFTVTTITTVGYGDMSASTFQEQIVCSIIMLIGVIAFSMASGALTNYISDQEAKQAALSEKMGTLEKIQESHALPRDLYLKL
jgi:voltage-gated potassium channel Kch